MHETTHAERTILVNGRERASRASGIPELLQELGYDPARPGIAVAINDEVVPRGEWARRPIGAGDRVEIVTAVQGG